MATVKEITPKATSCSKREVSILATACKDMENRGIEPMKTLTVIQVESCYISSKYVFHSVNLVKRKQG